MTEKEKAKSYDEVLKKVSVACKDEDKHLKGTLERTFPKFNEDKDEIIKTAILNHLKIMWGNCHDICGVHVEDAIDWLEKQRDKDKLIQELGKYKVKYTQEVLKNISNKDDERLRKTAIAFLKDFAEQGYENAVECIDWLKKQDKQKKQVYFPKFTFDDILALQCCMETVKKVQEDKELYEQLNLIHSKMYDAYWLEKQGKNSTDKIEPRFKVGDWVVNKFGDSWHIDSLDKKNYQVSDGKGNYNYFPISKQDKMHLWTIQDAKDGDVLAAHECYVVFKEIDGLNIKCHYTYHYLGFNPSFYIDTLQNKDAFLPATKEQRDALMKAMNYAGYEWDAEKKKLKKFESKQDSWEFPIRKKDKFDPKTLKQFDRVLVRDIKKEKWNIEVFLYMDEDSVLSYVTLTSSYIYCIPYNDETKHLVGTTDEAPEYYRYWED